MTERQVEVKVLFYVLFYKKTNYVKKNGGFHFATTNLAEALTFNTLEGAIEYVNQNFSGKNRNNFSYGKVITQDGNKIAGVINV